jgi:hypothetical protein
MVGTAQEPEHATSLDHQVRAEFIDTTFENNLGRTSTTDEQGALNPAI